MSLNNLNSKNLIPFKNKILNSKFSFKDFIIEELPVVPSIYFKQNNQSKDPIGNTIINHFYTIKFNLEKLETSIKFISSILLTCKCNLESIKISNNKYKLLKKNLLIPFHDTFNETFRNNTNSESSFIDFMKIFINNNHNILNNYNDNFPYFFKIFQNEYNDESKSYFLKLFKKYIEIRSNLLQYLINLEDSEYGLNSFKFMFDIINSKEKNINKNNCNNKQYENYIINNKNNSIPNNNNFKVFDKVSIAGKEGVIIGINYYADPETPFSVQIGNEIVKYGVSALKKIDITTVKPTLDSKISLYDSLYYNKRSSDYYKNNHLKNMNKYYKNLLTSINSAFENQSNNLYEVLINGLNIDLNLIKFIFYYVDTNLYDKAIDSYTQINEYIYNNINSFDSYYDDYIKWYNKLLDNIVSPGITTNITSDSNFEEYFDNIFQKLEKNPTS